MTSKFLTIVFLVVSSLLFSQVNTKQDTEPRFPGGDIEMRTWVRDVQKISLDEACLFKVECLVAKDGKISFRKIVSMSTELKDTVGIYKDIKSLIGSMPRWEPAKKNGSYIAKTIEIGIEYIPQVMTIDQQGEDVNTPLTTDIADRSLLDSESEKVYIVVEQMPVFPGGEQAMFLFLKHNLRYPRVAAESEVQGKVVVSFIVTDSGYIKQPSIIKRIGFGCDEEVVRLIHSMPRWKPGKQNGRPVNVKYNLPVKFSLNDNQVNASFTLDNSQVDSAAKYKSRKEDFLKDIATNYKKPAALSDSINGMISFNVYISSKGMVDSIDVYSSPDARITMELNRVITLLPKWIPAIKDKQKIRTVHYFMLPVKRSKIVLPE